MSDNDQLKLSGDDLIQKTSKKQWISFTIVFLISWSISLFLWFQVEADRQILFTLNNSNFGNGLLIINRLSSQYGMPVIVFIYMLYLALSLKFTHLKRMVPPGLGSIDIPWVNHASHPSAVVRVS